MTTKNNKNLFCTILTHAAPTSNYRGENEENRPVLQRINKNGKDYIIFSSESIRFALREIVATKLEGWGKDINRKRRDDLIDEDGKSQLSVQFYDYCNADLYADDFLFGYMIAMKEDIVKAVEKHGKEWVAKRDSVFKGNNAVALSPFRIEATFHQSPRNVDSPWSNTEKKNSILLNKEISHTAVQYPFALSGNDCRKNEKTIQWVKALLDSIGELNNVGGGHTRNLYDFAPKSVVIRLTPKLAAGYDTYGFKEDGSWSELSRINENDLPRDEFYFAGEIVRNMKEADKARLNPKNLFENPDHLIEKIKTDFLG
ncbi:CRISPR-associated protein Cas7/Cst2/DevR, subtype I-B/TNEAP [Leptospira kirschneri str. H2]|uniref:type I-B CRISPR-associated protein Cas7/Cst2/DevR n=1 Tax=Leptospira kirschneri TaxID=29507 RepID=UPI000292A103|nr:type I-B CRISPR-associated protein Cas7/Cst2/DevR [Leptospira kirschneri]EKO61576.1 CRISPR-associated protein Cas7/Cst2/DevR, subtype I-B/TNEAP [Leptospira kirschneri str. H2]